MRPPAGIGGRAAGRPVRHVKHKAETRRRDTEGSHATLADLWSAALALALAVAVGGLLVSPHDPWQGCLDGGDVSLHAYDLPG